MKVTLPKNYKGIYTIEEWEQAKRVIECMKEDELPIKEYAEIAVKHALKHKNDGCREVLKVTAETAKNSRQEYNRFCGDSGFMDVWLEITAETFYGFVKLGVYLTDIWNIGDGTDYTGFMWIHYFTEK